MKYVYNYNFISLFILFLLSICYHFISLPLFLEHSLYSISIFVNLLALIISFYFAKSKPFTLLLPPLFFSTYLFYPDILGLDGGTIAFWYTLSLCLSCSFIIINFLSERALISVYGGIKFLFIFFILLGTYFFLKDFSLETRQALEVPLFDFTFASFIKLPQGIFFIILISCLLIFLPVWFFYGSIVEKSLFYSYIALLIPALFFQTKLSFLLFYIVALLFIITAIIKESYKMAFIDTLTGIPARRALEAEFLKLGSKYTLAMADIDHFKKFNDTYGHDVGDDVLKLIAKELSEVKGGGKAFRYGGEEFTILFKNKTADNAYMYLEEIRENIAKRGFTLRSEDRPKKEPKNKKQTVRQKSVNLSVSIGVATSSKTIKSPFEVLKLADNALYKAKQNGRNCVVKA